MNCPQCHTLNRPGAKFCDHCGSTLPFACPQCGAQARSDAKFCHNCGFRLAQQSPTQTAPAGAVQPGADHGQRFMPQELVTKLEAARHSHAMQGERRIVTMLFSDVKGSTTMAGQLDPEEWAEIMNSAFEHLIAPIYRYEGTIARLMGDAILAFFGAPIAHEDDPQRAVLAGLAIIESIQPFRQRVKERWDLDFNVRVGINTGLVVVGEVGSDLRMEYTALGDAINLAARMEQTAQPGTVRIAGDTYRLVAPLFEFEDLGDIEVKGKVEPVPAYRVLGRKAEPGPLRGIAGLQAPLIGRDREIGLLQATLSQARQGSGQIVCLLGEAGLGKSRLIAELHHASSMPDHASLTWYEVSSLSYETAHPYALFQQLLRRLFAVTESDPPRLARQKFSPILDYFTPDQHARVRQVLDVMFAWEGAADQAPLEGETFKRELFDIIRHFWRTWVANKPTILVCDDLHWADMASVALLQHLFQLADEAPLLFLCAMRPDRTAPGWQIKQTAETMYPHRYNEVALTPLTSSDGSLLVDRLLTVPDLPPTLRDLILQKAEGNPFFVEEVVRTLIDSQVIVRQPGDGRWRVATGVNDITLPDNLQALLIARIDRLEEDARRTLQLAAVVGRTFYYRVLRLISDTAAELDRQLSVLQRTELIREAGRVPELEYAFRHALTQEAAYNTILLKRRREFHRRVAEVMEQLFANRLEEYAPLLGRHFYEAGDYQPALKYYTLAGDEALRLYANAQAIAHYTRALECTRQGHATGEQLRHLYTRRGRAQELSAEYEQALGNYEEMEARAHERGDQVLKLAALIGRATIRATANRAHDPVQGQALLEQARILAQELGDQAAEAKILWNMMILNTLTGGALDERIACGQQSLALARQLNLREQMAFTLLDLWYAYAGLSQWAQAREVLDEGRELWRAMGNYPMFSENLTRTSVTLLVLGDYAQAITYSDEAFRLAQASHNVEGQATSRMMTGLAFLEWGQLDKAMAITEEAVTLGKPMGHATVGMFIQADLGWMYGLLGLTDRGIELAQQARLAAEQILPIMNAWAIAILIRLHLLRAEVAEAEALLAILPPYRDLMEKLGFIVPLWAGAALVKAEVALAKREFGAALTVMNDLLHDLRQAGIRLFLPDTLYLQGLALAGQGKAGDAVETLTQAQTEATALGSRRTLWPILVALSDLAAQRGATAEAAQLRRQAQEIIAYIADHAGTPELRASFLNQSNVRALHSS